MPGLLVLKVFMAADRDGRTREAGDLFIYQLVKHWGPSSRCTAVWKRWSLPAASTPVVSLPESTVGAGVIRTAENLMIARLTLALVTHILPLGREETTAT